MTGRWRHPHRLLPDRVPLAGAPRATVPRATGGRPRHRFPRQAQDLAGSRHRRDRRRGLRPRVWPLPEECRAHPDRVRFGSPLGAGLALRSRSRPTQWPDRQGRDLRPCRASRTPRRACPASWPDFRGLRPRSFRAQCRGCGRDDTETTYRHNSSTARRGPLRVSLRRGPRTEPRNWGRSVACKHLSVPLTGSVCRTLGHRDLVYAVKDWRKRATYLLWCDCMTCVSEAFRKRAGSERVAVIELENVAYSYGGGELLSDISLRLQPGSFHFLTGPSGAGKTTLLKLCYGALVPTAGILRLFDVDLRTLDRDGIALARRRIGVVHQDCQFLDHLPVADNIALPLTVSGRDTLDEVANLRELVGWVGLKDRADALPPELSGGERQRAALARAVIMSPDVILADEPTGNVDWDMSQRLMRLLIELNRMGKTVMIATHDLALIRAAKSHVQTRVLRISNRRLQLAGADLCPMN